MNELQIKDILEIVGNVQLISVLNWYNLIAGFVIICVSKQKRYWYWFGWFAFIFSLLRVTTIL